MASVAYNFMNVDTNAHSKRYDHDKRDSVVVDMESDTASLRKAKKRGRKKSTYPTENKNKIKVQVWVQFFKVGEIDTLKEQYSADVIVRAKWREPQLDGESQLVGTEIADFNSKYWNPKLSVENTIGDPKEVVRHRVVYNNKGEAYVSEKRIIKGTFMENLELNDFPFDVQDLTVTVASELPSYEVDLIEDHENRHVVNRLSFVDEQEWHLYAHTECEKKDLVIDQMEMAVKRSALSVKCRAARRPGYFVWNIFMVTFLICSLSFATFSVKKDMVQNRLQLSFTLVLTAVAFKSVVNQNLPRISYLTYMFLICSLSFATFSVKKDMVQNRLQLSFTLVLTAVSFKAVVNQNLPRISYLTYMDKYLLASMIMLSMVCAWHGIVTRWTDPEEADFIENIVLGCFTVVYFFYNVGFIILIYIFPYRKRRRMKQKDKIYKKNGRKPKH